MEAGPVPLRTPSSLFSWIRLRGKKKKVNILPSLGQTSGLTTFPSFGECWVSSGTEVDGEAVLILTLNEENELIPATSCLQTGRSSSRHFPSSQQNEAPVQVWFSAPQILLRDFIYKCKRGLIDASKLFPSCEFGRKARMTKRSPPALPVIVSQDFLQGLCANPRSCRRICVAASFYSVSDGTILGYSGPSRCYT